MSRAPESSHAEYSGLAKGKKQSRSLLELMDPKGDYQSRVGTGDAASEEAGQAEVQETRTKKAAREPAEKKEPSDEVEKEYATEALVAVGDGRIRLVLNYPLGVMVCFMALVIVICAVLVGWKLGQDRAEKRYQELLLARGERIERKIAATELEEPGVSLDE